MYADVRLDLHDGGHQAIVGPVGDQLHDGLQHRPVAIVVALGWGSKLLVDLLHGAPGVSGYAFVFVWPAPSESY